MFGNLGDGFDFVGGGCIEMVDTGKTLFILMRGETGEIGVVGKGLGTSFVNELNVFHGFVVVKCLYLKKSVVVFE